MSAGAGEHTPEPWSVDEVDAGYDWHILGASDGFCADVVGNVTDEANAARIVACVNACAGIPTDQLSTLMGEVRGVLEEAQYRMPDRYNSDIALSNRIAALLAKLPVQP